MNKFSHLAARCDHLILIPSLALSLTGIVCLYAITRESDSSLGTGFMTFLSREVMIQSAALVIGLTAAAAILMLGYRYFIDLEKIIYILSLFLLLLVYIPGLGGCRIEDMAILTSDGFIDPITSPKQLIEL